MKRIATTAALLFATAIIPATASATGAPTQASGVTASGVATQASAGGADNITDVPSVRRDLRLAEEFWAIEQPKLSSPCLADQVLVTQMENGVGDNGQVVLASDVWAETGIGACTIDVAPVAWALGSSGNSNTSYMMCILVAHEYGHTLGLPDTESVPMMSANWARRDDPLCDRAVYGWSWTLHKDREWLRANRHALRMARRMARREAVQAAEVTAASSGSSTGASSEVEAPAAPPAPPSEQPTPVQAPSGATGASGVGASGPTGATGATGA